MANFYLQPQSDIMSLYELHATTDISVSFASEVTSYPIEDGSDVTDNVVLSAIEVSFQGILTDVKQEGSLLSIDTVKNLLTSQKDEAAIKAKAEYIEDLRRLQKEKEIFLVYFSGDNDGELSDLELAILTQFDISKTAEIGSSWEVSVTLQEIRVATRAQVDAQPSADFSALLAANKKGAGSSADLTKVEQEGVNTGNVTAAVDGNELELSNGRVLGSNK